MQTIPVIDSDTHIHETEATWDFLRPDEEVLRPKSGQPSNPDPNRPPPRYWLMGNKRRPRASAANMGVPIESRELTDIDLRIRDMDELGVETQVIYPSLFLTEPAETPEAELAWCRSYNRWLAERCAKSHGRLRWVCIPPLRNMEAALEELRFAKDHGACGVLKKGDLEAEKWPPDEYFWQLYEEAQRLDMPICVHIGSGLPEFLPQKQFEYARFMRLRLSAINAVFSMIALDVMTKFPKLRLGCIEVGASWVPFVKYQLLRFAKRRAEAPLRSNFTFEARDDIFAGNRIYVTAQVDEDLPSIISAMGDSNLLVGSDYSHEDPSTQLSFVKGLQHLADAKVISTDTMRKMLYDNPKAFYGL